MQQRTLQRSIDFASATGPSCFGAVHRIHKEYQGPAISVRLKQGDFFSGAFPTDTPLAVDLNPLAAALVVVDHRNGKHCVFRMGNLVLTDAHDLVDKLSSIKEIDLQRARLFVLSSCDIDRAVDVPLALRTLLYGIALMGSDLLERLEIVVGPPKGKKYFVAYNGEVLVKAADRIAAAKDNGPGRPAKKNGALAGMSFSGRHRPG